MCSNYRPSKPDQILNHFGVSLKQGDLAFEAWPGYAGSIIRPTRDLHEDILECIPACFGIVTSWADPKKAFRNTYNARTETVSTKPSYRNAWKKRQFCIIPTELFFEPCYETGVSVRWKIEHKTGRPLGIAGIYEWRPDGGPDNGPLTSFSMLTVNATDHELMKRFHRPEDEKRMVVILEPQQYQDWLFASLEDIDKFLIQYPADSLIAAPAPLPPRSKIKEKQDSKAA